MGRLLLVLWGFGGWEWGTRCISEDYGLVSRTLQSGTRILIFLGRGGAKAQVVADAMRCSCRGVGRLLPGFWGFAG